MTAFILRRTATVFVTLIGASVFVFLALALLGGDTATSLLDTNATPEAIAALREQLGLNMSLWHQYVRWTADMLQGDFGTSIVSQQSVGHQIAERALVTLPLAVIGMTVALLVAVPAGIIGATRASKPSGIAVSTISQIGLAVPAFWAGLMLASLFAVRLGWFPAGGFVRWGDSPAEALRSLVLPAVSIGLVQGAWLQRYIRSSVLDVMGEDYIRTARSKGMTRAEALRAHGLRNAALPVVTVLGIQFGILVGGTVVIENVYFLPGLGSMVVNAVTQRDLILIRSTIMVLIFLVIIINFITDIIYGLLDPRVSVK